MEGTLTQETSRKENEVYAFKGDEEYVQILTEGSVEAANLANNHSYDYGEKSYTDTIQALEDAGISTFGYDRTAIVEIKGVKVGLLGTYELDTHEACEEDMIKNIQSLQEQGAQIIIASFHWGIERANIPNETQVKLAHSAIDHGADLVLGHHPHVLQGIETYKGKNIVYSLANFCFGGNSSPSDMDSMIYQQTFTLEDGELTEENVTNIIPVKVSSSWEQGINDYQPVPVEGDTGEAIISRLEAYSQSMAEQYGTEAAQIRSSWKKTWKPVSRQRPWKEPLWKNGLIISENPSYSSLRKLWELPMLNYLWGGMLLVGILYGGITGNMNEVTEAALSSAEEAVSLCITMAGIVAMWVGLMEIARVSGLVDHLTNAMSPLLHFLFPQIPEEHRSLEYISANMIANFLGLGWAATPFGLKAMEELGNLEEDRRGGKARENQKKRDCGK